MKVNRLITNKRKYDVNFLFGDSGESRLTVEKRNAYMPVLMYSARNRAGKKESRELDDWKSLKLSLNGAERKRTFSLLKSASEENSSFVGRFCHKLAEVVLGYVTYVDEFSN